MCDKVKMSKEQTPKDFESYLEQMGYSWNDFDYTSGIEGFVEQYAQAKVLEALEREFTNYENNNPNKGHIEHYETEVKPKYE